MSFHRNGDYKYNTFIYALSRIVLLLEGSDDLGHRLAAVSVEIIVDAVSYLDGDSRINEIGCTYLYGRCSCQQELFFVPIHPAWKATAAR